jgi:MFS family permease
VLLLLLFCSSNASAFDSSSSSKPNSAAAAAAKFWRTVSAAGLAAAAGAANTLYPDSYPMLLVTKATQGAASVLYFVDCLGLVASVYPRACRTQAMAVISAGLTVGDALGPVVGGSVFKQQGCKQHWRYSLLLRFWL